MKKIIFVGLLLSVFRLHVPQVVAAEVVDRVVAIVGNEMISQSDVKNYKTRSKDPLEALIREKLLKQEMDRLGIAATDQEINSSVQEILNRNKAPLEALKAELAKKGTTLEEYKKNLAQQIRQMKFLGQVIFPRIKLSESEIQKKMGTQNSEEARTHARMDLLQAKAPQETEKFLDEVEARAHIEFKK